MIQFYKSTTEMICRSSLFFKGISESFPAPNIYDVHCSNQSAPRNGLLGADHTANHPYKYHISRRGLKHEPCLV